MSKEKLKKLTTKFQTPKSNHGITLVALIITIVVMLILVGVTLSIALGENGVISTAKEAKEKTEIAAEKEQLQNAIFATMGSNGEVNLENIVLPEGFTEVEGSVNFASKVIYQGPSGQQYQVDKATGEITEVDGENRIEAIEPDDLKDGYTVTYGDYEYTYSSSSQGWSVAVLDKTKEEYAEIATSIYGKPIISLANTFNGCTNMKVAPEIPKGTTDLYRTFYDCKLLSEAPEMPDNITEMPATFKGCSSLKVAPKIPESVTNMNTTFYYCTSLEIAPEIPNNVTNMSSTFGGCSALIEPPEIPNSVSIMTGTFDGCKLLKVAPTIPNGVTNLSSTFRHCAAIETISEIPNSVINMENTFYGCSSLTTVPEIPNSVTNMTNTFYYCSSLTTVTVIPSSVTNMDRTFQSCIKLQGDIRINASPTTYTNCFQNAGTEGTGIVLKGSSTVLNELAATNTQGKVTVSN